MEQQHFDLRPQIIPTNNFPRDNEQHTVKISKHIMKQGTMSENQQNDKETYLKRLQLLELLDSDDRLYLLHLTFRTLGKIII